MLSFLVEISTKIWHELELLRLTVEWLENTDRMDSLDTPDLVAREKESYLYQMDSKDNDLADLEYACASPILDAKYGKTDDEELVREHIHTRMKPNKANWKGVLLKYEILFDGVFENILASPCILNCYQRLALFAESYTQYLKCTWQLSKKRN